MSGILEKSEKKALKKEKEQSVIEIKAAMNSFAREITEGGLGSEMMTELTAEPKKVNWFKRMLNKLFYTI